MRCSHMRCSTCSSHCIPRSVHGSRLVAHRSLKDRPGSSLVNLRGISNTQPSPALVSPVPARQEGDLAPPSHRYPRPAPDC